MSKFTASLCVVATMKLWRSADASVAPPMMSTKQLVDDIAKNHVEKLSEYRNFGFTAGRKRSVTQFIQNLKAESNNHAETVDYLQAQCSKAQQRINAWQNIKPEGKMKTQKYYRGYKAQMWLYCTGAAVLSNDADIEELGIWMFNRKEFTIWFRAQRTFDQSEAVQANHSVCQNPSRRHVQEVVTCVNDICVCVDEEDFIESFDGIFYGFMQWVFSMLMISVSVFFAVCQRMNWFKSLKLHRLNTKKFLRKGSSGGANKLRFR